MMRALLMKGFWRRWLAGVAGVTMLAGALVSQQAQAAEVAVEGTDYSVLSPAQPTSNPSKIVVTEFFSYLCSHCYAFYPVVTPWAAKQPKDVVFERVPVSLGRSTWQPMVQAFYALQALGKDGVYDKAIFNGIFTQNAKLSEEAAITEFFGKLGVKTDDFSAAYHSFAVESSAKRSDQMMKNYKVAGTPTLVVNGKYVVSSEGTKNYEDLLARADKVIAKARAEQRK